MLGNLDWFRNSARPSFVCISSACHTAAKFQSILARNRASYCTKCTDRATYSTCGHGTVFYEMNFR